MKFIKNFSVLVVLISVIVVASVFSAGAANSKPKAYVNSSLVNIRSGAGKSYKVIASAGKKTTVTLLNGKLYNKEWYHIRLSNGKKGYIFKKYLTINKKQLYIPSSATGYAGYKYNYKNFVNTMGKKAKWTSSNKNIAKVSSSGKVTCLKNGKVTIKVKAGSKSCSSKLTVKNASVTLSQTSATIFSDSKLSLKAICSKAVTFSSSDTKTATVSSSGVVTPLKTGTVKVYAKSKSGSASCTVTIKKRVITLNTNKTTLYKGCNALITASGGLSGYTYKSSNTNVLTVTNSGVIYAVDNGTAKITCTSGNLTKSKTFKVKTGSSVNISNTTGTLNKGMTMYLKSSSKGVKWTSNDSSIATVNNGYVYGVNKGTAVISASTSSGEKTCLVTVEAAQPVRFVYSSENSALLNDTVKFYAITDMSRTAVKFKLTDANGKISWITNTSKTKDDGRYTWTASKKLTTPGVYTVIAYSHTKSNKNWATGTGGSATAFVNNSTSRTAVSYGERRATTKLINTIANYEGFLSTVTMDKLVDDTPTIGYGRVVYAGSSFYNGMTQKEAYAYLVKTVNESGYTSNVNKLLIDNKIKFNQSQFDALVDFSYNLGAYCITLHEELIGTLLDSYGKDSYDKKGFVNTKNVALKSGAGTNYDTLKNLSPGTTVTLVSTNLYNSSWYNVKLSNGTTGYVKSGQITRRSSNTEVRNLKNVNVKDFSDNFLEYHHASGTCYKGLLNRRVDEVEMFFYNDYTVNGSSNSYGLSYACSKNSGIKLS